MKILKCFLLLVFGQLFLINNSLFAQAINPDTVKTGIYVTSIHDINFKDKEYTVNFWLWLKYKNKDFNFVDNLELPQAKTVTKSFSTIDTSGNEVYLLMKLQCVMKDSWAIDNFPFDHQTLRLSIENSQFDAQSLIFVPDTLGKQFDPRFTLRGWNIDSLKASSGIKIYETAFGDPSVKAPHTEYSSFKVKIGLSRDAFGLFWKMFLGMYVAFLIAYMCFYIHSDSIDSRFGLSVGSLFAVIGNKYIIDGSLPESTTFTLVDTLHGITLIFILIVIVSTAFSLKMIKKGNVEKANRFDRIFSIGLLIIYILLNIFFILSAINS
ncbi:hypothetical protein EZ449_12960 [Pedobacter frigidisoli]|uniref:Neurotransmitter-gated ion-channel ligand binding domain-containing protein n=1 Tax=Pedobacter frigidisoli TaxID=2530455 RepID=A0A4R0NZI0_9SPHI|nr:hypothetical protein [Pedobacter frigidisoli]TCD08306.1 hypothetical protein EZ449_12960 [Pedobacter frigidisoli]